MATMLERAPRLTYPSTGLMQQPAPAEQIPAPPAPVTAPAAPAPVTAPAPPAPVTAPAPAPAPAIAPAASPAPAPAPVTPIPTAPATAQTAISKTYDPKAFAVTSDQTVQGQLKNILDTDSPLMQQAAVRANQAANEKGLMNSSIAVGAGQAAVMDKALPIATSDAGTYERANTNTVNSQNAALNFGAAGENQASLANAQMGTGTAQANADAANRAFLQNAAQLSDIAKITLTNENQLALAAIDTQTKTSLATLDAQNRQLLQSNQGAANAYVQAVTTIGNISMSNTMTQEAKDAAIASQLQMLNEQLKVTAAVAKTEAAAVGSLDLSQYFKDLGPAATAIPGPAGANGTTSYPGAGGQMYATQDQADQSLARAQG